MIRFRKEKGYSTAPYSVNISLTEKCPLRCPFCFHKYENCHELDFQTVCNYIDELTVLGTAQVQFSGGEPLLYSNLLKIISYSHLRGLTKNLQWLQRFKLKELDNKWGIRLLNLLFTIF